MRIQRLKLDRERLYANLVVNIKNKVRAIAAKNDCSMSFVTNTLLADILGITVEERYDIESEESPKLSRKARSGTARPRRSA